MVVSYSENQTRSLQSSYRTTSAMAPFFLIKFNIIVGDKEYRQINEFGFLSSLEANLMELNYFVNLNSLNVHI
jgi:hypothetical protein